MKRVLAVISCAAVIAILTGSGQGQQQGKTPTYTDVAPIFDEHCIMCHAGAKPPHGLKLDSYTNVMEGSKNGPVVLPGDSAKSEIIRRIRGISKPRMPFNGPPWLSDREATLLEQWIMAGSSEGKAEGGDKQAGADTAQQPDIEDQTVTYTQVAPILARRCVKCHAQKGLMGPPPEGYRLDTYESAVSGRERAQIIPGSPEASELVRRIRGQSIPRMPFDGPPYLEEEEIELISKWVEQGAADSNGREAPVPVGARVRLHGKLTDRWALDGMPLTVDRGTRLKKSPSIGSYVEVRGIVQKDGRIQATEIRPR